MPSRPTRKRTVMRRKRISGTGDAAGTSAVKAGVAAIKDHLAFYVGDKVTVERV